MGEPTSYTSSKLRIRSGGGSVKHTIASNVAQGNGGTSLPCAGCWVVAASGNTGIIKVNIDAAASVNLGIEVCQSDQGGPLWVPIDDVSKLYFYGATDADIVDVLYMKG
jgi:hypothetical protein